ncbi:MAG: winged helix-turn-helix domain-containing protein [Tistlia sp.]|uniref:winged helix-turn-helix domain-containing protein n=1 Tax=Tistlia sp. TaxID=3057121 RepID=UPI0034A44B2C
MIYAFEDCRLDTRLFELRRGGEPVPLEPQVYELLALLVAGHERVVTKDEILAGVWNGRIVSEAAVSSRIKAVRRAIGDDGSAQRLLRTVQRRGFRFVGQVRELGEGGPVTAAVAPVAASPPAQCESASAEQVAGTVMQRPAIAVMPFHDTTDGAGSSYLADGVTEEVIAELSAWRLFPVISRNTAFRYRGSALSAPELGRAVGARYLLTGSLQRAGGRLKLSAALIDAEADRELWSGRFLRALDEVFLLQEELAQAVVGTLEPQLRDAELQRILRKSPDDLTAWDLVMRAVWHANRTSPSDYETAERLAGKAAELEPDWYCPYALIAFVKFQQAMRDWSKSDTRTAFAETLAAARRALDVDGNSWLAHALAGVGELWTNQHYERALDHVNRAIQLNPSACWTYHFGGCIAGFSGLLDIAMTQQRRVYKVDPAYPYTATIESDLALWTLLQGRLGEAERHLDRSLQWDPAYGRALQRLVAFGGLAGRREVSDRGLARLAELGLPMDRAGLIASYPFREVSHRETFFDGLRRAGVNL